jgi:hypothetical protein
LVAHPTRLQYNKNELEQTKKKIDSKWKEADLKISPIFGSLEAEINEFLRVEFALEGQLIHGHQMFTQWNWNDRRNEYQMRGKAQFVKFCCIIF